MQQEPRDTPPTKRRKLSVASTKDALPGTQPQTSSSKGLDRPVSPPLSRRKSPASVCSLTPTWNFDNVPKEPSASQSTETTIDEDELVKEQDHAAEPRVIPSPVQLTRIEKLSKQHNVDAVGLADLLGDPLIKECWNFNYLFDLDFVMQYFDSDVRDIVKVKIVHGFWKRDDGNRIALLETAERYPNIELLSAYIPDPYGTHHSKMLILFRHDDTAQVVIHTANMIHRDWANMTQAVWTSPPLPLLSQKSSYQSSAPTLHPIGSGERFKIDLLHYLGAYGKRLDALTAQLKDYDFSSIRAAFLGSAPSRQKPATASSGVTAFGWLGLRQILSSVPIRTSEDSSRPHIVSQVSSVATLGPTPTWLSHFQSVLSKYSEAEAAGGEGTLPSSTKGSTSFTKRETEAVKPSTPKFSVVFPTPKEIRMSLDGYTAGGSIHWKTQSVQQQKQLEYMHSLLCHWAPSPKSLFAPPSSNDTSQREANRGTAAPHIKTYIRFSSEAHQTIDWAMVTSANLSKQAWGEVVSKKEEIWIQSWETGVVLWPALYSSQANERAIMVPVFGSDTPIVNPEDVLEKEEMVIVGFRMPYDVPLIPYAAREKPWCAAIAYEEPDRYGRKWGGYGR